MGEGVGGGNCTFPRRRLSQADSLVDLALGCCLAAFQTLELKLTPVVDGWSLCVRLHVPHRSNMRQGFLAQGRDRPMWVQLPPSTFQ